MQVTAGAATWDDCAMTVRATVVSYPTETRAVFDAGSKVMTYEQYYAKGYGRVVEYPDAEVTGFSEEHGILDLSKCAKKPQIGEAISVIPQPLLRCHQHDGRGLRGARKASWKQCIRSRRAARCARRSSVTDADRITKPNRRGPKADKASPWTDAISAADPRFQVALPSAGHGLLRLRGAWADRRHARHVGQGEPAAEPRRACLDRRVAEPAVDREDGLRPARRQCSDFRLAAALLHPHRRRADGLRHAGPRCGALPASCSSRGRSRPICSARC